MSKFWSSTVRKTKPYVPGEQPNETNVIKLNTNENPYPPSPKALEAMQFAVNDDLRKYPSPTVDSLRKVIAKREDIEPENVFVGNGSDEVLAFAFQAFFLSRMKPLSFQRSRIVSIQFMQSFMIFPIKQFL